MWRISSGERIKTFCGHLGGILSLVVLGKGDYLASGSEDCSISVWKVSSGERVKSVSGHCGGIWSLGVSGDGQYLAAGSEDCRVSLWRLVKKKIY